MSFSLHSGDARVCCEGGIIARTRYEIGNGTNMFFSLYSLKILYSFACLGYKSVD
jgi:peroxiredoxin family protein